MAGEAPYRFDLDFDAEHNVMRAVQVGRCTLCDLKTFIDALLTDPRWTPGMRLFNDFRRADASGLSNDDLREYLWHALKHTEAIVGARSATVVDSPVNYGVVRVWEAFAALEDAPFVHRVFRSVEEAACWLGVPAKP